MLRWMAPFLLALLAGCGGNVRPEPARSPLPACDASRSIREAMPPASAPRTSLILLAVQEWIRFGAQEIDYGSGEPVVVRRGVREDGRAGAEVWPDAPARIAAYWRSAGFATRTGRDDVPWSAAFISWLFVNAGVPADVFCPDQRHSVYVERIALRAREPGALLVPRRIAERGPQPGDLVCAAREGGRLSLDNLNRGAGHCDIVVERHADAVLAIGGNVQDSVSRSRFPLDAAGRLVAGPARPFFTVIENRLSAQE